MPRRLTDIPHPDVPGRDAWIPPPRFGQVSFDGYLPAHPSQAVGRATVEAFAHWQPARGRFPWSRVPPPTPAGLYLDGGFGVGKTHLLAAAWHAAPERRKVYLSFAELVAAIGVAGMRAAIETLGAEQLYCIDEFELDDPGNTLIVKTFLASVFARGARVLTTSNTAPEAQGQGRFDAASFRREIQSIATRFTVVTIDGPDHRVGRPHRRLLSEADLGQAPPTAVTVGWDELHEGLLRIHPVRYGTWVRGGDAWVVRDAAPIPDQQRALRFVHLVDKLYDQRVPLWLQGDLTLDALFDASYAQGAYAKKHDRCRSRLAELLAEAEAVAVPRAG
ncbi:MAG: cell division protein ZapE [bacterium]|nr:cell division protein ZapE [bacterium]